MIQKYNFETYAIVFFFFLINVKILHQKKLQNNVLQIIYIFDLIFNMLLFHLSRIYCININIGLV
jgi:hypothetical protein